MRLRIAVAVCALVLLGLLGAAAEALRRELARPSLVAVETVDDLRATRTIRLPKGARAWVGLSATQVAVDEPLLLYALVEGDPGEAPRSADLGPFRVRARDVELEKLAESRIQPTAPARLYVKTVAFQKRGTEEVALLLPTGTEAARASITVTDEKRPTFVRLDQRAEEDDLRGWVCVENVAAEAEITISGRQPVPHPGTDLPRPFDRPALRLRLEGEYLVIESSERDILLGACSELLAARLWVNGEPVVLLRRALERWGRGGGLEAHVRQLRVHFHVDEHALRAKTGDRIGVQLLAKGGPLPRLTNRVDFVLP